MIILCIQHGNYFTELDCGTDGKKVFGKKGKFLYKFGQRGLKTESCPLYLSLDRSGHLLVCQGFHAGSTENRCLNLTESL